MDLVGTLIPQKSDLADDKRDALCKGRFEQDDNAKLRYKLAFVGSLCVSFVLPASRSTLPF